MNFPLPKKPPANRRTASDFMLNASTSERKRVFMKVIEESIADQLEVIEKAERLQQQRTNPNKR